MNKRLVYIVMAAAVVMFIIIVAGHFSRPRPQQPKVIPKAAIVSPEMLAKEIKVTPKQAAEISAAIPEVEPVISYTVQAPTIQKAAEVTAREIEHKSPALPVAAVAKSDRTAVVANEEQQRVEVYKIDLDKQHKVKVGMTYINDKLYPTIGYQAGRVDSMVQLDGSKVKGATIMYTVAQW